MRLTGNGNDYHEIAHVLTEQYNSYASMTEDFEMLDEEWVAEQLQHSFVAEDVDSLLDDDFSRGMIMGQLRVIHAMTAIEEVDDGET